VWRVGSKAHWLKGSYGPKLTMQSIIPIVNPEKSNRAIAAKQGWSSPDACRVLLNPKLIKESGQDSIQDQHAKKRPKHGKQCSKIIQEPLRSVRSRAGYREGPIYFHAVCAGIAH
jgi:hypothetical protein